MKRVLLGTTALVAAGFFAGEAQAKFDVTVNGSWNTAYGYVNEDHHRFATGTTTGGAATNTSQRREQAIDQDWEVHFRAQQTLDNGLIVGGRVELEGATMAPSSSTRPPTIRPLSRVCWARKCTSQSWSIACSRRWLVLVAAPPVVVPVAKRWWSSFT